MAWSSLLAKHKNTHASERYKAEEANCLKKARADPRIAELLRADIELYKTANAGFDRMLSAVRAARAREGTAASMSSNSTNHSTLNGAAGCLNGSQPGQC